MARRRARGRETVSIPPCEVRDRRRAGGVDRLGELWESGGPSRSGRQPRLGGHPGRSGSLGTSPERLRSGLRSATTPFGSRTPSHDPTIAPAPAPPPLV